jgi:hypothetical protein
MLIEDDDSDQCSKLFADALASFGNAELRKVHAELRKVAVIKRSWWLQNAHRLTTAFIFSATKF